MLSILKRNIRSLTSDQKFSLILTGSAYALSGRIITACLNLLASIIIARVYGANALGILAMVTSVFTLATIFSVMGTNTSILRLITEHVAKHSVTSAFRVYRKTQYSVAAISILIGFLLFLMSGSIAEKVFSKPYLTLLIALSSVFVLFKSLMDLNTEAVRGLKLIRLYILMQLCPPFIFLVLLLIAMPWNIISNVPVYAQFAAWAMTAVLGIWIIDRAFKNRMKPDDYVQPVYVGEIMTISAPMLMTASMHFFIGQVSIIILGMFRSATEVGYYSVAVRLSTLTVFVLGAINTMAAPKFSELFHEGKMEELFYVAKKSTKLIFWTTTPLLVCLIVLGRPLLSGIFGEEYALAYSAMVLLVIGQFVNSISGSTGYFMSMTGHQKVLMNIVFFAAAISLMFNYLLVPKFGIIGAAFASMISLCFWNLYTLLYIRMKYGKTIGYVPLFFAG
jgi:O-antigen/teichoic acid export membrane protein